MKKTIGDQLKEQRAALSMTQLQLYEKSRISPFTISRLETNTITDCSTHVLRQLSKALNSYKFDI